MIFDYEFSPVPSLRACTVPSTWSDLSRNSRTKSVNEFYDVIKTWIAEQPDPSDREPESSISRLHNDIVASNAAPQAKSKASAQDKTINNNVDSQASTDISLNLVQPRDVPQDSTPSDESRAAPDTNVKTRTQLESKEQSSTWTQQESKERSPTWLQQDSTEQLPT